MKRFTVVFAISLLVCTAAFAGVQEVITGVFGFIANNALASLITGILGIGVVWYYVDLVARAGIAVGTFLIAVCTPFLDRKLEKGEVEQVTDALKAFKVTVADLIGQAKDRKNA